jgi:hypothetical protein
MIGTHECNISRVTFHLVPAGVPLGDVIVAQVFSPSTLEAKLRGAKYLVEP